MNLLILAKSILGILFFVDIIVVLYFHCAGYCFIRKLLIFVYLFFNFILSQAFLLFIIVFHYHLGLYREMKIFFLPPNLLFRKITL